MGVVLVVVGVVTAIFGLDVLVVLVFHRQLVVVVVVVFFVVVALLGVVVVVGVVGVVVLVGCGVLVGIFVADGVHEGDPRLGDVLLHLLDGVFDVILDGVLYRHRRRFVLLSQRHRHDEEAGRQQSPQHHRSPVNFN